MSDENNFDRDSENDPLTNAMQYGTIWTVSLFEKNGAPYKITRGGTSIRIPRQLVWWGIPGFALGAFIGWLIFIKILGMSMIVAPVIITIGALFGMGFYLLGRWSPMAKDTGEDLKTYAMIKMRKRIATRKSSSGKKTSIEYYNSKAVGDPQKGMVVKCQMWLGTQPLSTSAPKDPFYKGVYKTPYVFKKSGEYVPIDTKTVDDGLGSN